MKMSYYCAAARDEDGNLRAKRKKDLVAIRNEDPEYWKRHYGPIVKIEFEYDDGFDLLDYCLSPGDVEHDAAVAMIDEE